jgi:hypothetical protein
MREVQDDYSPVPELIPTDPESVNQMHGPRDLKYWSKAYTRMYLVGNKSNGNILKNWITVKCPTLLDYLIMECLRQGYVMYQRPND